MERWDGSLKTALRARLEGLCMMEQLTWVLLGLCMTPRDKSIHSSGEKVSSNHAHIPGDCVPDVSPLVLNPNPSVLAQHHAKSLGVQGGKVGNCLASARWQI